MNPEHAGPAQEDLALAREFTRQLAARLKRNDFTVRLFGSRAAGTPDAESDLDLFVAVPWDDPEERVKNEALDVACALTITRGVLISPFVADRRFLQKHRGYSFLETVEGEGIRV